MKTDQAYNFIVKAMSLVFVVIGAVILVLTLSRGGGPLSTGAILGVIFIGSRSLRYQFQNRFGARPCTTRVPGPPPAGIPPLPPARR